MEKTLKDLFVPYEIALLAKKNGFNENCFGYYVGDKIVLDHQIYSYKYDIVEHIIILAPLWQQLIDWFKNQHNIMISIDVDSRKNTFAHIRTPQDRIGFWVNDQDEPLEYYAALNKAFLRAFKMIPQISE